MRRVSAEMPTVKFVASSDYVDELRLASTLLLGMGSFADVLSRGEVEAIHAYVVEEGEREGP
jgi:hypothetical protein